MIPGVVAGGAFANPPLIDPFWPNVVSLLNFQGAHGSNVFTDAKGKPWEIIGGTNARIEVSGGESYGIFDGDGDGIRTPDHDDFNFAGGDFCIETIITPASLTASVKHIAGQFGDAPNLCVQFYVYSTTAGVAAGTAPTGAYDASFDNSGPLGFLAVGNKAHLALVRHGNNFKIYVNGVLIFTKTDARTLFNSTKYFEVGRNDHISGGQPYNGKMHAFRVTKGVARYTANFIPPSHPFPES